MQFRTAQIFPFTDSFEQSLQLLWSIWTQRGMKLKFFVFVLPLIEIIVNLFEIWFTATGYYKKINARAIELLSLHFFKLSSIIMGGFLGKFEGALSHILKQAKGVFDR